jgi:tetratricopeptide (TPR) repeat protein
MLPLRQWVDQHAGDDLRQIWHGYWAAVLGHIGRLREGVASFDIAIACAQRTGERPVQAMNLLNQCVVLRTMGALERAHKGSAEGLALSSDDPDNANHRLARLMHARNQAESGRFASAVQALDDLLPAFEAMGVPFWVQATRNTQARLWQHLGQFARALQALQPDDSSLPGWMRANGVWLRLEVQQWLGQPARESDTRQALAYLENDPYRRTGNAARGLRYLQPGDVMAQAGAMAERAKELELFGTLAATQMHLARAARVMGQHEQASAAARALVALMQDGYAPDHVYLPEAWLLAGQALHAAGDTPAARNAWRTGQAWVQQHALPQVPPPFIESFLHRNPVNRELLAQV